MNKKIILYSNPILRKKSLPIEQINKTVQKLATDLTETMHCNNGVGLSAIQIGIPKRMMVYEYAKPKESKDPNFAIPLKILINPIIVKTSKRTKVDEEGCLSFPDLYGPVERSTGIRVKALDLDGKNVEFDAKGLEARIIQHEIDHMDGILFVDRLTKPGELYTYEIEQ